MLRNDGGNQAIFDLSGAEGLNDLESRCDLKVSVEYGRIFEAHQRIEETWPTWQSWPSSYFHRLFCRFEVGQLHPFSAYLRGG